MELGLILTLCGLGVSFLIPAFVMIIISIKRKKSCTAMTTAVVTEIKTRSTSDGRSYHPVYEYEINGITYKGTGAYLSGRVPSVGTSVTVMYNPDNPKKSYIPGYDNKVLKILSIVFSIAGSIPILICVCIALLA